MHDVSHKSWSHWGVGGKRRKLFLVGKKGNNQNVIWIENEIYTFILCQDYCSYAKSTLLIPLLSSLRMAALGLLVLSFTGVSIPLLLVTNTIIWTSRVFLSLFSLSLSLFFFFFCNKSSLIRSVTFIIPSFWRAKLRQMFC